MTLLDVRALSIDIRSRNERVRVVDRASFTVGRGEIVALVGESGSGKTLTGLSILGLLPEAAERAGGVIAFQKDDAKEPLDLASLGEKGLQRIRGDRIAMVFQDPMTSLNPYLTIGDQLGEVLILHRGLSAKDARERSIAALKSVHIADPARRVDEYPHQLSGGMRQRVMIAMALLCDPLLIIADEPTTALDPTIEASILDLFVEHKEGVAVLLITHDLGVVERVAERALVMYAGRIVEQGKVGDLFERPAHPYTRGLLRSIPTLDSPKGHKLTAISGAPPLLGKLPSGCPFHPRCDAAKVSACSESFPEERSAGEGHLVCCHVKEEA